MEQIRIYKNGKINGYYYQSNINNNLKILAYINNDKDTYFIDELIVKIMILYIVRKAENSTNIMPYIQHTHIFHTIYNILKNFKITLLKFLIFQKII
ncbi:hypothetical protein [Campylobacter armoricus]|uniref:hypothetical protein n=1 Tax=Campylobacter armoricus TaxID=2505970 RepID=UPI001375AF3B|nr:hypothetical protein [Campylobacter armoricus]